MSITRIPLSVVTLDGDATDGVLVGVLVSDLDELESQAEMSSAKNALDERIDAWLEWIVEIKEPGCRYDHDDYCQEHNLDARPCPMEGISAYVQSLHGITT